MTPNEYMVLAWRTAADLGTRKDVIHAGFGIITETAEVCDMLKRNLAYGQKFDPVNVVEEVGDMLWYCALLCRAFNVKLADYFPLRPFPTDKIDLLALDMACVAAHVAASTRAWAEQGETLVEPHSFVKLISLADRVVRSCGFTLEDAMVRNVAKLQKRYPDKFTPEQALNRDLVAEREALEGHGSSRI
jgi:NTP pyrophosphatase (non-canonical NTP hydrolase)